MDKVALLFTFFAAWRLIKRDSALRNGVSRASWIPTIWLAILASRPVSFWVGGGGSGSSLDGNATDRLVYLLLIGAAFYVISRRQVNWSALISQNWAVFLFYFYLLVTVLWAEYSFVSFKRWFKEFGNIIVLLVILTEANPQQAFRAVFVRCAYLLIPMSYVLIRWFSELGRHYNIHSGDLEAVGVTTQKNSLGALILVCGLVVIWDILELSKKESRHKHRLDIMIRFGILAIGGYLLWLCDAKTSMVCLSIATALLVASRISPFKTRPASLGFSTIVAAVGLALFDWIFGFREAAVTGLGRDMTFTGRTDVWRELLSLKTDPFFGDGFCSFWSNQAYLSRLPEWVASANSAHNGYLEIYLDTGWIGVFFLAVMLVTFGFQSFRRLSRDPGAYSVVCFAVFVVAIIDNISESYFAKMTCVGFLFLLGAIHSAPTGSTAAVEEPLEPMPFEEDRYRSSRAFAREI